MRRLDITKDSIPIWLMGIAGLLLANIAYFSHDFLGSIITASFFLTMPGYLLLNRITTEIKARWEVISFSLGLSVLLLMVGGLALNSLHTFGLSRPLTTLNIFITLDLMTGVLFTLNRRLIFSLPNKLPTFDKEKTSAVAGLTLLPLLAIGGAIRLNNGASNILTMTMFALIAIWFVILVWRRNLASIYPYAIVMMGLSILFSTSLRGWFITGHDIQREFYVFQLSSKANYWDISSYRNPYNACLSITLLPTIIAKITAISAPYIYKAVFQIIFSLSLAPAFFFVKRLSNSHTALIGSFIFLSFPTFLNDMPFLNRQEIAFSFFSLLLLATFLKIARKPKTLLVILCIVGLILSHYSSSYVTLGILTVAWVFYKLLSRLNTNKVRVSSIPLLSLSIILVALLGTFLWNIQVTASGAGLKSTLTNTVQDLIDHSSAHAADVSYSLFNQKGQSATTLLTNYAGKNMNSITISPTPQIPITFLGGLINRMISVHELNATLRAFAAKILQVLLVIGTILLFVRKRKNMSAESLYLMSLSLACICLLVLQTLLPRLSIDYGTLRFFQQTLMILCIPIVFAAESLFGVSRKFTLPLVTVFFTCLFLDLSGFIPQITGGYPPQLPLNNDGSTYNIYYIHKGELLSASWASLNNYKKTITMDRYAQIRFIDPITQGHINTNPPFTYKSGTYFYQDYANAKLGLYATDISSAVIEYRYSFNSKASNLLYMNQQSNIYQSGP